MARATACLSAMLAAACMAGAAQAELHIEGETRLRYETLSAPFRAGAEGSDQQVSWRSRLLIEARGETLDAGLELFDSRAFLTDEGSRLSSTMINTLDVLQAYVRWRPSEHAEVQAGRFVMNVGSRRLIGENAYRNWPNAFEGVRAAFEPRPGWRVDAFYTAPVRRRPSDFASLLDNEQAFDEGDWDTRFYGGHLTLDDGVAGADFEIYAYGFDQEDGAVLLTPGMRLSRGSAPGRFDFDIEVIAQTGAIERAGPDLDVTASTLHLEAGYTFDAPWRPRLSAQYVYASGDEDPFDAAFERFNPFYSLRRGDLGQTGLFGPFDRDNISAIGVRLDVRKGPVRGHLFIQDVDLASDRDRWRRGRFSDPTGAAGDDVGFVVDAQLRWWIVADRVRLDTGAALARQAPLRENRPRRAGR
mgnify:FL=1